MVKDWPVIKCLSCGYEWRRYARRKLTPARNCQKCYKRLHIEGTDFLWVSHGKFFHNEIEKSVAKELKMEAKLKTSDRPALKDLLDIIRQ